MTINHFIVEWGEGSSFQFISTDFPIVITI